MAAESIHKPGYMFTTEPAVFFKSTLPLPASSNLIVILRISLPV